jgi:DNA-binding MarR family transcriptional regulator
MAKLLRKEAGGVRERLTLDVLRQFRLVYGAVHRHFREVERRCGLSGAQAWMLREISLHPDIGVTELAARLAIHQSTTSQLVNKLVRQRHVSRSSPSHDRRRVGLRVTRSGARVVRCLPRPAEGVLPHALEGMPTRSLRQLRSQLSLVVSHLETRRAADARAHLGEL